MSQVLSLIQKGVETWKIYSLDIEIIQHGWVTDLFVCYHISKKHHIIYSLICLKYFILFFEWLEKRDIVP